MSINLPPVEPELQKRPAKPGDIKEKVEDTPIMKGYTAQVVILIDGELDTNFAVTTKRPEQLQEAINAAINAWEI